MDEELTLRDIADTLGRYKPLLIGLPLGLAALAVGASSLLPDSYTSTVITSVTSRPEQQSTTSTDAARLGAFAPIELDPNLLPSAGALAGGYEAAAPARLSRVWNTSAAETRELFDVTYDETSKAITLQARSSSSAQAQERAQVVANDFAQYANAQTAAVVEQAYRAQLQETEVALAAERATLLSLRDTLRSTPPVLAGTGQPSVRTAVAASGIDPRLSGDSDQPINPAYAALSVEIARTQARVAALTASITQFRRVADSQELRLGIAGRVIQVRALSEADLPTQPDGPGRVVLALLGLLLGGFLAILIAFVHNALRPATTTAGATRRTVVRQGD